jgi:L-seryl-tRNA(Ser) seleniumtransferase
MKSSRLRAIPSVEKILQALGDTGLPRPALVAVTRRELAALRAKKRIPEFEVVLVQVRNAAVELLRTRLQPVINGTGVIIHTNLGRAPFAPVAVEAVKTVAAHYNNLEYDLARGARGGRATYLDHNLAVLCQAEGAAVVNNCAAALVLLVRHFATPTRPEVVISRGELVQIGGGFRIPEILESSGATLREIGTTNKTTLSDYSRAIGPRTGLVLKVHRSNFFMEGFVESPRTAEIARMVCGRRVPFVEDLGSGAVTATESVPGLAHEPTPSEVLRDGVSLVCFSGDKLLGGPQAGVIAGKGRWVAALKRDPLFRALRCDKLVLSAMQATVDLYLQGDAAVPIGVPVFEMARVSPADLRVRASAIIQQFAGLPVQASVGLGAGQIGGGALPRSVLPSVSIELRPAELSAEELSRRLRAGSPPVIGYVQGGRLKLDLRTVFPAQDTELARLLAAALGPCPH